MRFRPIQEPEWEVTDLREVTPTPLYYDSQDVSAHPDLEISCLAPRTISGTYTFDMTPSSSSLKPRLRRRALDMARTQLLNEARKEGYNFLVLEGWSMTIFRKSQSRRIQVRYEARPAVARGLHHLRTAPFVELLDTI